jgi:hypothetical protein
MDVGGVSPAELSAAIGTPVGQIQAEYNQSRPRGLFSTGAPALEAYLKTSPFKPVLMEHQHLRFLHRPQQKQHRHLGQVVQTQTSLVLLVVLVVMVKVLRAILILPVLRLEAQFANAISAIAPGFADSLGISPGFTNSKLP